MIHKINKILDKAPINSINRDVLQIKNKLSIITIIAFFYCNCLLVIGQRKP